MSEIGVLASRIRFEEKRILEALDRRRVDYTVVDPRTAAFDLTGPSPRYHGVLLREISHYRTLSAARVLEAAGVCVVNSADVVTTCGDKLLTTLALRRAGVPTPRCLLALTPAAALEALDHFGYPAVVKPLVGSWGRLVSRLRDRDDAEAVLETRAALPHPQHQITYVQRYVPTPGRDIRGLVAGEEVLGAVYRVAAGWRANTARDAETLPCPVTDELAALLRTASAAIGPGFYGIDLLEDADGNLWVNEVNHTPEFHGASEVLDIDLADRYADYALNTLIAG